MLACAGTAHGRKAGLIADAVAGSTEDRNVTAVGWRRVEWDLEVDLIDAGKTRRGPRIGWRDIPSAKLHGHVGGSGPSQSSAPKNHILSGSGGIGQLAQHGRFAGTLMLSERRAQALERLCKQAGARAPGHDSCRA